MYNNTLSCCLLTIAVVLIRLGPPIDNGIQNSILLLFVIFHSMGGGRGGGLGDVVQQARWRSSLKFENERGNKLDLALEILLADIDVGNLA